MLKKFLFQVATLFIILFISFSSVQHPITSGYIHELRERAVVTVMTEEDPLFMEILRKQNDFEIEPQDALVDRVWKAIPGYNGLTVDIEASYKNMQAFKIFEEEKLVFNQIPPKTKLKDLPPSPIYRGHSDKPMVGFMVNVAWGNEYIPDLLNTMKEYDVKSTFFLDGSWVQSNPKLAKMIVDEGHEIGNHAYSHPNMKNLSRNRIHDEMIKTNDVIKSAINITPEWFAPPSGSYRQEVVDVAHELGMYTLLWTVDTVDWKRPEPLSMAQRVIQKTESGSLILMHPTSSSAKGIDAMIKGIMEKGLTFGPVSEVLSETRITK